jgi:prophage DNA circulation protein
MPNYNYLQNSKVIYNNWRDNLIDASFRGVLFKIINSRTVVGRRNVLHQYPFRDQPFLEDLGSNADKFTLDAYVIQNNDNAYDYFGDRDALINALKQEGPGLLTHPFYGYIDVGVMGDVSIDESFREGGIARFRITFVQSKDPLLLTSQTQDTTGKVDNTVNNSITQAGDGFIDNIKTEGEPDTIVIFSEEATELAINMMKGVIHTIKAAPVSAIARATSVLAEIEATVADIVTIPSTLATTIQSTYNTFLGLVGLFEEDFGQVTPSLELLISTVEGCIEMNKFGENPDSDNISAQGGVIKPVTVTRQTTAKQSANNIAVTNHVRSIGLLTAMRIAVRGEYTSYDEAIRVMNLVADAVGLLLDKLGEEAADTEHITQGVDISDEDTYGALENARPVFIISMLAIGAKLARTTQFEVPFSITPALLLAYRKYEDLDRETDIIDRNSITHPAFLPSGQNIELLSE